MLFQAVVIFLPILNFFKILSERGKVHWRRSHRIVYNAKSQISRTVHNARMMNRCNWYFKFGVVKLFFDIKAVSLTFFCINSYDALRCIINNKFSLLPFL